MTRVDEIRNNLSKGKYNPEYVKDIIDLLELITLADESLKYINHCYTCSYNSILDPMCDCPVPKYKQKRNE